MNFPLQFRHSEIQNKTCRVACCLQVGLHSSGMNWNDSPRGFQFEDYRLIHNKIETVFTYNL